MEKLRVLLHRDRVLFALLLVAGIFYLTRVPLFVAGYYRNEIIPGSRMFGGNIFGMAIALIWLFRPAITFKPLIVAIFGVVCLLLSIFLSMAYLELQPNANIELKIVTTYAYLSTFILMPLLVMLGAVHADNLAPKIFKHWGKPIENH